MFKLPVILLLFPELALVIIKKTLCLIAAEPLRGHNWLLNNKSPGDSSTYLLGLEKMKG